MSKLLHSLMFFAFASHHILGLKLLVNDDLLEDDDDTWESDIGFSFKPFQGKCVKTGPTAMDTNPPGDLTGGNEANGLCYPHPAPDGGLSLYSCDGTQPAKDKLKYCDPFIDPAPNVKFSQIMGVLKTKATAGSKWKFSKYVHYVAKLTAMDKFEMENIADANKAACKTKYAKSFNVNSADYAFVAYEKDAVGGDKTASTYCYSTAGITWAKNDPVVKNMDGEEFEIMATGTFSLLSLKSASSRTVLEASATIDRAGTRCGATYIQNLTLTGQWVEDMGVPSIQVKAEAAVPKVQALQVNFAGEWQSATSKFSYLAVKQADAKKIILQLNKLKVVVSVDSHRIHEEGIKTQRFANFLNVNFQGITKLSGISVGGLLGRDSHAEATELPDGCTSQKLVTMENKGMLSSVVLV